MKTSLLEPRALCLLLISTLTVMSNITIAPALPGLANEFSGTPETDFLVKMLLPIPALFVVIFAPVFGWTADRFGRRNQIIIATIVFSITGAAGAQLQGLEAIAISRAILGICVAGLMTAVTSLISDYYSGQKRSQFMGLQQAFSSVGGILFIVTAGYLANTSARLSFYIYAVAILFVPLIFLSITENKHIVHLSDHQQDNKNTRWKRPLIGCSILIFCHFMVFYILPTQIPFFMLEIGITDPSKSGLAIGVGTFLSALSSIFFGKLVAKIQSYGVALIGFIAMGLGMLVLSQAASFSLVILGCGLMGICMGLVMPNFMAKGMELVPSNKRGLASGVLTNSIFIGQFVSPFITSALITKLGYSDFYFLAGAFTFVLALAGATTLKK
ncbi:MFS transporter [Marinomonas rhizomae]|uniref:Putative MFS family arabinose efflux permease n=1 Tax=Marinomonas rhizomae TaxID=491948 RepID=A0A366J0H2_9GAMM|nr:MFS transporter [Marinomonas rhizomae]RBP80563.1 putative MFS family arabinose efflux permease [Marinomonas rhizomae]RNF71796.1 MFS transporter [Marinomonas rhizomae]